MTAGSLTGQTVILRPSMAGKTIRAFDRYHEGHPLKIATYAEAEGGGTSILGLFNIAEQEKTCLIYVSDFLGKNGKPIAIGTGAQQFLIRSHQTSEFPGTVDMTQEAGRPELFHLVLPFRGYEILSAHPDHCVTVGSKTKSVSVLGLVGKMAGAAAIVSTAVSAQQEGQLQIRTKLKALGMLGLWFPGPESSLTSSQVHINMFGKILDEKWTRFSEVAGAQSATLV